MKFDAILLLIYTMATVFQVIIISITLIYIYKQSKAALDNVRGIQKTLHINAYLNHRQNVFEVNKLLLTDKYLAKIFGYSKKEYLAFMLIGYAEMIFLQRIEGIVNDQMWQSQKIIISKIFGLDVVQKLWPSVKVEYLNSFVDYIDNDETSLNA